MSATFDVHADQALEVAAPVRPGVEDSFTPASDCWRCNNPGFALRHDGTVHCADCMKNTPGVYTPLTPPG